MCLCCDHTNSVPTQWLNDTLHDVMLLENQLATTPHSHDREEPTLLITDHDPKPLCYQVAAENVGEFSKNYLAEGPEVWRVRISRPTTVYAINRGTQLADQAA
jgi:hypothetical protein